MSPKVLLLGAADQAASSTGLLIVGLCAAWILPPSEHGRLALMIAGMLTGLAVHTALILDPLTARGRMGTTAATVALALWLGSALVGALVAVGGAAVEGPAKALALGGAAAAGPALLTLCRRHAHAECRPGRAASAALIGVVLTAMPLAAHVLLGAPSAEGFLWAYASGTGIAGAAGLRIGWRMPRRRAWRPALAHHARLGGWLLVAVVPWAAASQGPLVILAALNDAAAAGAMRALLLLGMPVAQATAAVGTVLQPRLAAAARRHDVRRSGAVWGGALSVFVAPWILVLTLAPEAVVTTVFGPWYAPASAALPLVAAAALTGALGTGTTLALRAQQRGRAVAAATGAGAVVALATAWLLVPVLGLAGAAAALVVGRVFDVAVQGMALWHGPQRSVPVTRRVAA